MIAMDLSTRRSISVRSLHAGAQQGFYLSTHSESCRAVSGSADLRDTFVITSSLPESTTSQRYRPIEPIVEANDRGRSLTKQHHRLIMQPVSSCIAPRHPTELSKIRNVKLESPYDAQKTRPQFRLVFRDGHRSFEVSQKHPASDSELPATGDSPEYCEHS